MKKKSNLSVTARMIAARAAALAFILALLPALSAANEGHGEDPVKYHESKIYGVVEEMPQDLVGTWIVNGREIVVTRETKIKRKHGAPQRGAYIEVEGGTSGKTFTAYEIEVKRSKRK